MGLLPPTNLHRHGHRRHQGLRTPRRRILRPTPEPHTGDEGDLSSEPRPRRVTVRRQFAASVGGQQEFPGGGEVAGLGGQAEEDIHHVFGNGG